MSKFSILSSFLAVTLLFQGCSNEKKSDKQEQMIAQKAHAILNTNQFVLQALDNKKYVIEKKRDGFSLKNAKSKVLILDIFATWCPPCQGEASHLASLQKKYKKNLQVIGITVEQNIPNSKLENFRKEFGANYTLVNSHQNRLIIDAIATQLKIGKNFGIPLMALYKDGKLINFYQGATEEEFIESDIKKALGK